MTIMNEGLRSAVAATLTPVQPLAPPSLRALTMAPLAALLLTAAPLVFSFRDLGSLGWLWSWGASIVQMVAGLAIVALALREAVPGRNLPTRTLLSIVAAVVMLFVGITIGAWSASPFDIRRHWWQIGAMCIAAAGTSALPAVALSSVLIVRAFPVRPLLAGGIAGFGSGLLADAGWRLFCHYSEPTHVLAAHLGAIAFATVAGATLTEWLTAHAYGQSSRITPRPR
jgi:hypothetical protein